MRAVAKALLGAVLGLAGALTSELPALADDGLGVTSVNRYVVDAKATTLHAHVTMTIVNVQPDVRTADGYRYYFWTSVGALVPAGAERIRATSAGATLGVFTRPSKDPSVRQARITLPARLTYGQQRTIELTYDIPGEAPRSEDLTRVGPGYASFEVTGLGDPGQTRVEIRAPAGMAWDSTTDALVSTVDGSTRTLTATTNNEDGGFWAVVSLRDRKASAVRKVTVGPTTFTVEGWKDDPRWAAFVDSSLTRGLPRLEGLVGRPWPKGLLTVREDTSVNLRGYDGWFDPSDREIVVGERLDSHVLFHELAHAWAGSESIAERWMSEGLAENLATRTVTGLGLKETRRARVTPTTKGHLPLSTWKETSNGRSGAVDDYGYPASAQVMGTLLSGLDAKHLKAVVSALVGSESAYEKPGVSLGQRTTWQRAMDLVDTRGGRPGTARVFTTWVLTPAEARLLPGRARARAAYAAVDRTDGGWQPPAVLRSQMYNWAFGDAATTMAQLRSVTPDAARVQSAAAAAGVAVPPAVRQAYEDARDAQSLKAAATMLPEAVTAVSGVGAADRAAAAKRGPVGALGALVSGVDAHAEAADRALTRGDLRAATDAARVTTSRAAQATWIGAGLLVAALALVLVVVVVVRRLRARRRRAAESREQARADAAATLALVAATRRVTSATRSDPRVPPTE